jgi:hypothetical protein
MTTKKGHSQIPREHITICVLSLNITAKLYFERILFLKIPRSPPLTSSFSLFYTQMQTLSASSYLLQRQKQKWKSRLGINEAIISLPSQVRLPPFFPQSSKEPSKRLSHPSGTKEIYDIVVCTRSKDRTSGTSAHTAPSSPSKTRLAASSRLLQILPS